MRAMINGAEVGYDDFGQGPAVLFIHDFPLNRKMWWPQVEALVEAGFRAIMVDLRGFGESGRAPGKVEIQTYSSDVVSLLNYLGIGRAVICGMSLGGYVLFDLMENYPQRVAGACLANCRPVADDIHERARRAELISGVHSGAFEQVKGELFQMLFSGQEKSLAEDFREQVRDWIQTLTEQTADEALKAIGQRKDYTFLLRSLKIPTLLLGAEKDPLIHHNHIDIMAQHLPNCYRAVKLGCGHLVNLERQDEFNRHLVDFLRNLTPRRREMPTMALRTAI